MSQNNGVTVFRNITQTKGGDDFLIEEVMSAIKEGHWQTKVLYYRNLPENTEDQIKKKKEAKKSIPYFTGSGTFKERNDRSIKKHNGRIVLDLDEIEDVDEVKALVCADPYAEYVFSSVGGKGVAVVVKIGDPNKHLESWKALSAYFKSKYGLIVDKSTKDISRARFVSYDPRLWSNPKAKVFRLKKYDELGKERAKKILDDAKKGEVHHALIKASRLLGGYAAGGLIEESEAEEFLVDLMSRRDGVVSIDIERKKVKDGIANGKMSPITPKQIESETQQSEADKQRWREIYSFIHELNRTGRKYTDTDIQNQCKTHLFAEAKVRAAFKKVFEEHREEFGILNKPEIYQVEVWLRKNWDFSENEITQVAEFRKKGAELFDELNIDTIYRKMQHVGFKFSLDKLKSLLRSDFVDKYNPFFQYFNSLPEWNGETDHISNLANYVKVKDQVFFVTQFKKALVRSIGCSLYSRENRIVFVFVGEKQNTGKSTFIRFLNPFGAKYYTEAPIQNNKDSSFAFSENFIYNLEELASLSNMDVNRLKSIISISTIKERKAYARDVKEQPRRCNFWASTNKNEFLTDTENTRWLCFDVESIDWGYSKEVDINKVWAQALALYKDSSFSDQLTKEEAEKRDRRNKGYEINDYEKELIKRVYKVCLPHEGDFVSNADILDKLQEMAGRKLESRYIGKNMVQLGFARASKKRNGHTVRGYYVLQTSSGYVEGEKVTSEKPF